MADTIFGTAKTSIYSAGAENRSYTDRIIMWRAKTIMNGVSKVTWQLEWSGNAQLHKLSAQTAQNAQNKYTVGGRMKVHFCQNTCSERFDVIAFGMESPDPPTLWLWQIWRNGIVSWWRAKYERENKWRAICGAPDMPVDNGRGEGASGTANLNIISPQEKFSSWSNIPSVYL